jgi:hypothetical protein
MLEFIFRLYNTKMIDSELWLRWESTAKSMMTIPKFKKVWDKTKVAVHIISENLSIRFRIAYEGL